MISQTEFAVKITKVPMSHARKKMRDDFADKVEIHASCGVSGSISWLAGQTRPDVSCQVSQLQQTLPQPTVAQVCGSNLVVRRVHQHADLGLKIRRTPVHNMMLLLHVDASLNTGGPVGSQGGYVGGVADKSLLEGCDAPWSPMAWRSFKMSRTVPSSLGAEAQAMSVALGFVEWATLFLQELIHGQFENALAPLEGSGSDRSAHGCDMCGLPSRWRWLITVRKKWWSSTSVAREQKSASAGEGEEYKKNTLHGASWRQKTLLPGSPVPQVVLPELGGEVVHLSEGGGEEEGEGKGEGAREAAEGGGRVLHALRLSDTVEWRQLEAERTGRSQTLRALLFGEGRARHAR